jgi:hypothetical protein
MKSVCHEGEVDAERYGAGSLACAIPAELDETLAVQVSETNLA